MTRQTILRVSLAAVLVAVIGLAVRHRDPPAAPVPPGPRPTPPVSNRGGAGRTVFASDSNQPAAVEPAPGPLAVPVNPPAPAAATRLEQVAFVIRDYRNALAQNPTGTNVELTAALLGNNPKQIRCPVPEGSSVSAQGELCDCWGRPYFFHQLSATEMEIRSAGPDQVLWTPDDVIAR